VRLRKAGIRGGLITCVHDSIMLEVIEADAERAIAIMREVMTEAFEMLFPEAPTKNLVEIKLGRNWGEMKEVTQLERVKNGYHDETAAAA
jgi:DNA polymerase I-like protein with 3'-5' exonuclease and polymerase domains